MDSVNLRNVINATNVRILQENIIEALDDMPLAQRCHMFFRHDGESAYNYHKIKKTIHISIKLIKLVKIFWYH